ncbi:vitamin D 25-hydroxylase-like [Stegodyphus dumicola]|uniref:vitamin D 25-hydroxylase-like n=1 Tax=Stegodyphus dumicola TaxID=202533 RepID=UPI0015B28DEA|nr:vitamin D 25-hydroxylase-like [Stegodyphus dumicola]
MEYLKGFNAIAPILLGIFLLAFVTLHWWYGKRRYKLPPGPIGLPFLGYLPFIEKRSFITFTKLSKKYGKIYSLYLGRALVVVLNDHKLIKEAFNQQALLDRPPHYFDFHPGGLGFVGANGEEWVEQRRFSMKALREVGLAKSEWEHSLMIDVEELRDWLKTQEGKPVNIYRFLSASVSNTITTLVFGKRLPVGDPLRILVDSAVESVSRIYRQSGIVTFFPTLLYLIAKLGFTLHGKERKIMVRFYNFLKSEMEARKKVLANDSCEAMFLDGYLKEMERHKQKNIKSTFSEKFLVGNAQAMVIGGSESTRTAILWLLLTMVAFPEVQKKVQEEIDSVLGKDGKVSWIERAKLPYVNATIMEGQRWRTAVSLKHWASADAVVAGYDIPKGTEIIANAWAVHHDPEYWEEPEKFKPERFLVEENGKLTTTKPESYVPFSVGRRNCPGELVALVQLLHYFVVILQNFNLLPEADDKPPDLIGDVGLTYQSKPQNLRFVPRD